MTVQDYQNRDTFSRAVTEMSQTLYRIAYSILRNNADCEDAVQEAIIKAYSKASALRDSGLFKSWMIRILKNECFMLLRKRKKLIPMDTLPETAAPEHIDNMDLYNAMSELNPDMRLAMTLFYVEQYSIDEITYILQIPSGTVKSRLARGRDTLRKILKKEGYAYGTAQ